MRVRPNSPPVHTRLAPDIVNVVATSNTSYPVEFVKERAVFESAKHP